MENEGLVFGSAVVVVAVGLALLLYAEAAGTGDEVLLGGGVLLLLGIGLLAWGVMRLEEPDEAQGH